MALAKFRLALTALALLFASHAAPQASAQDAAMEKAAAKLATAIAHSKQKTVAILDFSGPGDTVSALGEKFADDLSASMAKSGEKLQVEDRSEIEKLRQQYWNPLDVVLDPRLALLFAQDFKTKAFVMGGDIVRGERSAKSQPQCLPRGQWQKH